MRKLSKREAILIAVMLMALIIVGLGWYVLKPSIDRYNELQTELSDLRIKEAQKKSAVAGLVTTRQYLAENEEKIKEAVARYYERMMADRVDDKVTKMILDKGLRPISLSLTYSEVQPVYQYLDAKKKTGVVCESMSNSVIAIVVEGNREQLQNLAKEVCDDPSMMLVDIAYARIINNDGFGSNRGGDIVAGTPVSEYNALSGEGSLSMTIRLLMNEPPLEEVETDGENTDN